MGVFVGLFDFAEVAENLSLSSRQLSPQVNKHPSDLVNHRLFSSNTSVRINGWLQVCSNNLCSSVQSSAPQVLRGYFQGKFDIGEGGGGISPGNFFLPGKRG